MAKYRVQRIWTVEMESWCEVEASSRKEAKGLALEVDDFDDQRILDGSDGPTEIGTVEEVKRRIKVDVRFYVRAPSTQEAVTSVMKYLPVLHPEPAVETELEEYDLHSVNNRSVIVTGFDQPYQIEFTEEGGEYE